MKEKVREAKKANREVLSKQVQCNKFLVIYVSQTLMPVDCILCVGKGSP